MLAIGNRASMSKTILDADVRSFAALSQDFNPVHLDDAYAKDFVYGDRVAHGMYVASFISAVLGSKLPGPGSLYLSQNLSFERPVMIGDVITAEVEVVNASRKGVYTLSTRCYNQRGETVIAGETTVKVLRPFVRSHLN